MPIISWVLNIGGLVLGIYALGRFKLLISYRYAAVITFIGGLIRALSTAFKSVDPTTQFWITFRHVAHIQLKTAVCLHF